MADGQCHLSFNILETKEATKNLTTDITITSKALMDQPEKKYIAISLYIRGNPKWVYYIHEPRAIIVLSLSLYAWRSGFADVLYTIYILHS